MLKIRSVILSGIFFILCILESQSQINFTSSNLPIVVINTNGRTIVDEPKIPAVMGIIDNGPGQINSVSDSFNDYNGNIGIELRGSSSQMFPKNNYGIETWDENLQDTSVSILGMPEEEDWVLHGPYSDKSLIRNLLTFKLARDMGRYASRTRLCELMLNGEYWGVYVFMEKVKRDSSRVNISKLNPDEISGDDITGGYIIKIDKFDGGNSGDGWPSPYRPPNYSNPNQQIYFQFDYPKNDEIVPQQKAYIQQFITDFETALLSKPLDDQVSGYKTYIDIGSFIDFAIINEVTRNIDAYRLSTFLYKDKSSQGGKLFIGPIWDYNLAFGNADYCLGWSKEGWAWDFNNICNEDFWLIPFWWRRFMVDREFTTLLKNRWLELRNDIFSTANIHAYIDSVTSVLNMPRLRNFQRWNIIGSYVWPNWYIGNSYIDEINYLKSWISERMLWLDDNFGDILTSLDGLSSHQDQIRMYPNPFNDKIMLEFIKLPPGEAQFEVFNALGQKIFQDRIMIIDNAPHIVWDGNDIEGQKVPAGIYISIVTTVDKIIYKSRLIRF